MPIIAKGKSGGAFTPAPAGTHAAVCVDVVDLGVLKVTYAGEDKLQHKIRVSWQIAEHMPDGKPFLVSKRYTLSLHEKASLRKDLEAWRGQLFTDAELTGFDVESIIGIPCYLSVIQTQREGETWANINAIMRLPRGVIAPRPKDYVRFKDRQPEDTQAPADSAYTADSDDIPF